MKRMNLLQMVMMVIMMAMVNNNSFAQGRGGHSMGGRGGSGREIVMNSNGGFRMRGGESGMKRSGHEMNRPSSGHKMNRPNGGHEMNRPNGGHEMNRPNGGHEMNRPNGGHEMNRPNGGHEMNRPSSGHEMNRHHAGIGHHPAPRVDHRGFVPGWEGRVRHHNGRWGYFRDNRWLWYDRYFDPVYYFANPLSYFNDYYYLADGGYIPGWEGRVRYHRGRWGYYRDGAWLWYDRYYAPDYYFAHPIAHFRHHLRGPVAAGVAGGIVAGAVLGALIGSL